SVRQTSSGSTTFVESARVSPTYFDVITALAFKHFADVEVDFAVVETGLGGRLDSTNVVDPELVCLTDISMDHMAQLGGTLEKIASEKAGIIKPGAAAVTCPQNEIVEGVLRKTAEAQGVELQMLGKEIDFSVRFEASRETGRNYRICFETPRSNFDHLIAPLLGEHQAINCGVALAAIDQLKVLGHDITDEHCFDGLEGLQYEGRMEVLRENPKVIVDAAHNPASVEALLRAIGQHFTYESSIVVFGCCDDKDAVAMLGQLVSGADKVIFTRVNSPRSADPHQLAADYTQKFGRMSQVADSLDDALKIAARAATADDLICITGSFFLVGEAKKMMAKNNARRAAARA
ncbi:MAG: cyanophycin synthetase, partial [Planctomycetota bacterium]